MSDNIFDYLKWRGDLSLTAVPAGEIDFAIFAQLSYCPFEAFEKGWKNKTLASLNHLLYKDGKVDSSWDWQEKLMRLWKELPDYPRFANVKLADFKSRFDPDTHIQFAAATFAYGTTAVVAFRGTDLSLTGWKEDFNLAYKSPVPAQEEAVKYLDKLSVKYKEVYVCGHSKGGNLAMYGVSHMQDRSKICGIYNFDGPGLDDKTLRSKGWKQTKKKLSAFVPESSVVGMLFDYGQDYKVVDADSVSILQHNNFNWNVDGPKFKEAKNLSLTSVILNRTVRNFLEGTDLHEREVFVTALFKFIDASGSTRSDELLGHAIKNLPAIIKTGGTFSPEEKEVLSNVRDRFIKETGNNIKLQAELGFQKTAGKIKEKFSELKKLPGAK